MIDPSLDNLETLCYPLISPSSVLLNPPSLARYLSPPPPHPLSLSFSLQIIYQFVCTCSHPLISHFHLLLIPLSLVRSLSLSFSLSLNIYLNTSGSHIFREIVTTKSPYTHHYPNMIFGTIINKTTKIMLLILSKAGF